MENAGSATDCLHVQMSLKGFYAELYQSFNLFSSIKDSHHWWDYGALSDKYLEDTWHNEMPFSWTLYYDRNGVKEYCAIGYRSLQSTEIFLFDDLSTPCKPMEGRLQGQISI